MTEPIENLLRRDNLFLLLELRVLWFSVLFQLMAALTYLGWFISPMPKKGRNASRLLQISLALLSMLIILRTIQAARPPYQTLYEALLFFAWTAQLVYLVVERRSGRVYAAGLPLAAVVCAASLYALLAGNPAIWPLLPALQSNWFLCHTIAAFVAYAVFVVAFAVELAHVALGGLLRYRSLEQYGMDADSAARFHRAAHRLILFGFPLLTLALVTGAVWAEQARGGYWSWDPRETWLLITWVVYALYLHAMTMSKWRGGRSSLMNMLGFGCMVMTVLGAGWLIRLLGIPRP